MRRFPGTLRLRTPHSARHPAPRTLHPARRKLYSRPMADVKRIGILTGGGDAPGLNAVIRAVVKSACNAGIGCLGLEDSFDGLLETNRSRVLLPNNVTGILRIGGTILGTVNRGDPFAYPAHGGGAGAPGPVDYSQRSIDTFNAL